MRATVIVRITTGDPVVAVAVAVAVVADVGGWFASVLFLLLLLPFPFALDLPFLDADVALEEPPARGLEPLSNSYGRATVGGDEGADSSRARAGLQLDRAM